jgi:hypothetical protein
MVQARTIDGPMASPAAVLTVALGPGLGPADEPPVAVLVGDGLPVSVLVGDGLPVGVALGDGDELAVGVGVGVTVGLTLGLLFVGEPVGVQLGDPEGRGCPLGVGVLLADRGLPEPGGLGIPPMAPGPGPLFAEFCAMTPGSAVSAR